MDNREKLKLALDKLDSNNGLSAAFKNVEAEMAKVTSRVKREAESKATDFAKKGLVELRGEVQQALKGLVDSFGLLEDAIKAVEGNLSSQIEEKLNALRSTVAQSRATQFGDVQGLASEIENLKQDIKEISQRKVQVPDFTKDIQALRVDVENMMQEDEVEDDSELEDIRKKMSDLEDTLKKLRSDMLSRVGNQGNQGHGGQANRNIMVGGNSSTLSRYTDINLKAGANVTLTYQNNDNLKTTDLTIAATGGGGGGTVRSIATTVVSSTLGAVASTDYVAIVGAGVKITLPAAAGNQNLYTIKNTSTSSVLVVSAGAETIDGSANVIMPVQYTSVDVISDGANWQIT